MCPGVLCDMREARHGGYTLALHSGVRVSEPCRCAAVFGGAFRCAKLCSAQLFISLAYTV